MREFLFSMIGVLLGSFTTFLGAVAQARSARRQDLITELRKERREVYGVYLASIKRMRLVVAGIAAGQGLDAEAEPIDAESGMRELARLDDERGIAQEGVNFAGSTEVILASRDLNMKVWDLGNIVKGHAAADQQIWLECMSNYVASIDSFIRWSRASLGVVDLYPDRQGGPAYPERWSMGFPSA